MPTGPLPHSPDEKPLTAREGTPVERPARPAGPACPKPEITDSIQISSPGNQHRRIQAQPAWPFPCPQKDAPVEGVLLQSVAPVRGMYGDKSFRTQRRGWPQGHPLHLPVAGASCAVPFLPGQHAARTGGLRAGAHRVDGYHHEAVVGGGKGHLQGPRRRRQDCGVRA